MNINSDPQCRAITFARGTALLFSFALLFIIFNFHGNTLFTDEYGSSLFAWLCTSWTAKTPGATDSSHGPLIVLASILMVWIKRLELMESEKCVFYPATVLIILGLAIHWCGLMVQQNLISLLGLITLGWTVPLYIYGPTVGRITLFPYACLIFAAPLDFLDAASFNLRLSASAVSEFLLNGIAVPVRRIGTGLIVGGADGLVLDVADPCSGLHSLTALCALTAIYAYFLHVSAGRKAILIMLALPIAYISNIIRIVALAVAANLGSRSAVLTLYHDASGYIVFVAAVLLTAGFGALLRKWERNSTALISAGKTQV